jgi:DNA-binding transcriptional MocR family regulator
MWFCSKDLDVFVKTTFHAEILIPIDRAIDVPLHVQLERQLRNAVRTGRLLAVLKHRADGGSPTIDHLALAEFLSSGHMDRHLRRMRQIYRHRRDVIVDALQEFLPQLPVDGVAAGLHLMVNLPSDTDEKELVRAAREKSIRILGASDYRVRPRNDEPAIVLGYGCVTEPLIRQGIRELARLITRSSGAVRATSSRTRGKPGTPAAAAISDVG